MSAKKRHSYMKWPLDDFSQITVQQKVKIVTTLCEVGTCDELWYCKEN